jgi:hypothetical protein
MISGYSRAELPGEAWAYNDVAIEFFKDVNTKSFPPSPLDSLVRSSITNVRCEGAAGVKREHRDRE